jgi:hypothetical protein
VLRSVLAVAAGLLSITALVEPLEFFLVGLVNGGLTTDPEVYSGIRNGRGFLVLKLVYNSAAAVAGGFLAARLARRAPISHGLIVALLQTAAFAWAVSNPDLRRSAPGWLWAALIPLTAAGIMSGAFLARARQRAARIDPVIALRAP